MAQLPLKAGEWVGWVFEVGIGRGTRGGVKFSPISRFRMTQLARAVRYSYLPVTGRGQRRWKIFCGK